MIPEFQNLSPQETEILLRAPALFSLMAASESEELSSDEKKDALELSHLKTVSADPALIDYYKEVEVHFSENFNQAIDKYTPFDDKKREELENEINILRNVIAKLDSTYAKKLHNSLSKYRDHVKDSGKSMFFNFIFPLPIPGINE